MRGAWLNLGAIVALEVNLRPAKCMGPQRRGLCGVATLDQESLVFSGLVVCCRRREAKQRLGVALESARRKTRMGHQPAHGIAEGIGKR